MFQRLKCVVCKSFLLGCLLTMFFFEISKCNLKMFVFQSTFNCQHHRRQQRHPKTDTFNKWACWFSRQTLKWLLKISDHLRGDSFPFPLLSLLLLAIFHATKSKIFGISNGCFFPSSAFVFLKKGKKRHIFLLLLLQCCIGTTWIRCNLTKSVSKSLKPWVSVPAHMFWDQTNNNTACVHRCWCCCYFSASWTAHQFASSSAAIRIVETHVHYCLRWIFSFGSVWFGFGCNGSSSDSSISSTRYRLMSGNSSKSRASERINTRFEGYTAKKYTNTENWLPYSPYSTLSNAL